MVSSVTGNIWILWLYCHVIPLLAHLLLRGNALVCLLLWYYRCLVLTHFCLSQSLVYFSWVSILYSPGFYFKPPSDPIVKCCFCLSSAEQHLSCISGWLDFSWFLIRFCASTINMDKPLLTASACSLTPAENFDNDVWTVLDKGHTDLMQLYSATPPLHCMLRNTTDVPLTPSEISDLKLRSFKDPSGFVRYLNAIW